MAVTYEVMAGELVCHLMLSLAVNINKLREYCLKDLHVPKRG